MTTCYCCILCNVNLADVEEPFYLAQITENLGTESRMEVRWFCPSRNSKAKTRQYSEMNNELELLAVQLRGRQNGPPRFRMDERHQSLTYQEVHFGFSLLKETGALPPEVKRQLRSINLAQGVIRRN